MLMKSTRFRRVQALRFHSSKSHPEWDSRERIATAIEIHARCKVYRNTKTPCTL